MLPSWFCCTHTHTHTGTHSCKNTLAAAYFSCLQRRCHFLAFFRHFFSPAVPLYLFFFLFLLLFFLWHRCTFGCCFSSYFCRARPLAFCIWPANLSLRFRKFIGLGSPVSGPFHRRHRDDYCHDDYGVMCTECASSCTSFLVSVYVL